jgi:hypothetical protein
MAGNHVFLKRDDMIAKNNKLRVVGDPEKAQKLSDSGIDRSFHRRNPILSTDPTVVKFLMENPGEKYFLLG